MRKLVCGAILGLCAAASASSAHASIILSLVGNPVAVAGGYDYTYTANLSGDEQLDPSKNPTFFTLYDFGDAALISTTGELATAGAWTFALNHNLTTSAQATSPTNNPAFADVRATYNGPRFTPASVGGTVNLGTFTLFTHSTAPFIIINNNQDAQLDKNAPGDPTDDTITSNVASVAVPNLSRTPVSEPASLALLGAGLIGLAMMRRRSFSATA